MQTLYQDWWFAGVVLPILVAIVSGIPLAIYTGIVVSRLMEFKTQRFNALQALSMINVALVKSRQFYDAGDEIRNALIPAANAFKADGQRGAYLTLDCIRQNLEYHFYTLCTEHDDRAVDMTDDNEHWKKTRIHLITSDGWKTLLNSAIGTINKVEPSLWATLKPTIPASQWSEELWGAVEKYIGANKVTRVCERCDGQKMV